MKAAHGSPSLASPSRHHTSNNSYDRMKSGLRSKSPGNKMGLPQFLRLDSTGEGSAYETPVSNHNVRVPLVGHQKSNSCRQGESLGGCSSRSSPAANGVLGKFMHHFTPQPSTSSNLLAMSQVQNGISALDGLLTNKRPINGVAKAGMDSHLKTIRTPADMRKSNRYGQWGTQCPSSFLPRGVFPCHVFQALQLQQRDPFHMWPITATCGQFVSPLCIIPFCSSSDAWSQFSFGNTKTRGQEKMPPGFRNDSRRSKIFSSSGDLKTTDQSNLRMGAVNTCRPSPDRPSGVVTADNSCDTVTTSRPRSLPGNTALYQNIEMGVKMRNSPTSLEKCTDRPSCDFNLNKPDSDKCQQESDVEDSLTSQKQNSIDCECILSSEQQLCADCVAKKTPSVCCVIKAEIDLSETMKTDDSASAKTEPNNSLTSKSQKTDFSCRPIDLHIDYKGAECLEILVERKSCLTNDLVVDRPNDCKKTEYVEIRSCPRNGSDEDNDYKGAECIGILMERDSCSTDEPSCKIGWTRRWTWNDSDSDSEEDTESTDREDCSTNEDSDQLWNSFPVLNLSTLLGRQSSNSRKNNSSNGQESDNSTEKDEDEGLELDENFEHSTKPRQSKHSTQLTPKPYEAVTKSWNKIYSDEPQDDRPCKVQFRCGKGLDLVYEYQKETYTVMELQKARDLTRANQGNAALLLRSDKEDAGASSNSGEKEARKSSRDLEACDLTNTNSGNAASLQFSSKNQDANAGSENGEEVGKASSDLDSVMNKDHETNNPDEDDDVVFIRGDDEEQNADCDSDMSCAEVESESDSEFEEIEDEVIVFKYYDDDDDDNELSDDDVVFG